jgi:phosphatidylserine/phosphatidylglycerophosphate/cardiolipin synthase-like enzyme
MKTIPRPAAGLFAAVCILFAFAAGTSPLLLLADGGTAPTSWQVYFSPGGGAQDAIIREVDAARVNIRVLAYSFTSDPIADALIRAHRRGVDVQVIQDGKSLNGVGADGKRCRAAGIQWLADRTHAIAHNKTIVVDRAVVLTGSFNFSESAETRNAENELVLRDMVLAEQYLSDWARHRAHAVTW